MLVLSITAVDGRAAEPGADGPIYYQDGAKINLCTVRGAKTSASANCTTPTDLVCRPVHTQELRFQSNYGQAWWMIEWPGTFKLSQPPHRLSRSDEIGRLPVKVSPSRWTRRLGRRQGRCRVQRAGRRARRRRAVQGLDRAANWPPVEARFVRIEWFGHNGSEAGQPGRDHPDLIVGKIQLYGPNRSRSPRRSPSAQSAWAGGQVALDDARRRRRSIGAVIDDSRARGHGVRLPQPVVRHQSGRRRSGQAAGQAGLLHRHAQAHGMVEAVGYSAIAPPRDERPRDMQVFTSPHAIGQHWELQKELHDIPGGAYEEIAFGSAGQGQAGQVRRRSRLEHARRCQQAAPRGYMAELYVYGTGLAGQRAS